MSFLGTDRFKVIRLLGSGSMGTVYLVFDRQLGAEVALKLLDLWDGTDLCRFKSEFRALADIKHPNLATLHELICEGPPWFFTMEYVEGVPFDVCLLGPAPTGAVPLLSVMETADTLRGTDPRPLTSRRQPDSQRLHAALQQLCAGVHAMHGAGCIHRDLKPSNVLVTAEGRVVVLDFGLARQTGTRSLAGDGLQGTPAYMAPEQAKSGPSQPAADWYAVGVMLYEVLSGRLPHDGDMIEILLKKQSEDPLAPVQVNPLADPELSQLCMRLLRRDPAQRPGGAEILAELGAGTTPPLLPESESALVRAGAPAFIGRTAEMQALRRGYRSACAGNSAMLAGPHGGSAGLPSRSPRGLLERGRYTPPPLAPSLDRLAVLVVDDEKNIRATLTVCLEQLSHEVVSVPSAEGALAALARQPFDLALVDLKLGRDSGLELVPRLLADRPELLVVIITAYATVETAVEAIRRGAWDYLPKPFTPAQIRHLVDRACERRRLAWRVENLENTLSSALPDVDLSSQSPRMRSVHETVTRAATSDVPVLLRGETGTGKTVVARALHAYSPRRERPFVVVNCPTLSEELLTSELFGHARGSFTGAVKDQPGRVEAAHGGTLFLDEIGEIPPNLQAKLLRFLQDKEFERVGESRTRRVDVRVVAATNRDLEADVRKGRFREDLLYRLNVIEVVVPALRERAEDILPLARGFLSFYARAFGRPVPTLSPRAEQALVQYGWPGNVRELRNTIERALILWPASVIEPEALPAKMQVSASPTGPKVGDDVTLAEIEAEHIRRVVARASSLDAAAAALGIDVSTLWRKRKRQSD
jgi:NtrC-family two-component system response regulator AlgB